MMRFKPRGSYTTPVLKLRADDIARVRELLADVEKVFRKAFVDFIRDAASDESLKLLIEYLERGEVRQALDFMEQFTARFAGAVDEGIKLAATAEVEAIGPQAIVAARLERAKPVPVISVSFNPSNLRAQEVAREQSARLVKEITASTRELVQAVIVDSFESGAHPLEVAREIRANIGLTTTQRDAVANYERLLRAGSAEALQRDLRDRRSDKKVRNAKDKPLTEADIKRLVDGYRKRYLAYRADVVARTEAQEALNAGRAEGMRQTLEQVGPGADAVEKTWNCMRDNHVRGSHDKHSGLDGKKVIGIDTPFVTAAGYLIRYPGDPGAPANERIQCRCALGYRILSPEERANGTA